MNYIVFDLEWNQPEDGKSSEERELLFEIIEIGAIKLNEKLEVVSKFQELVKPTVYHQINWRTRKMLHLKEHELDRGKSFPVVCRRFLDWCGEDYIFCTWGQQDITELQRNMEYFRLPKLGSGPIAYYNIQKIFGIRLDDPAKSRNLEAAVDQVKIPKKIPFHRAYSDAYYTGKIMQKIGKEQITGLYSFDLYHIPASEEQEVKYFSEQEYYFVYKGYEQKLDILEDKRIWQFRCAKCDDRALRPKIRWFACNSKQFLGAAVCDQHGLIRGRVKIRKDMKEVVFAEKFLTYEPAEVLDELREKKKSAKKFNERKDGSSEEKGSTAKKGGPEKKGSSEKKGGAAKKNGSAKKEKAAKKKS